MATKKEVLNEGLTLWEKVKTPQHQYTKEISGRGFKGTSINGTAMAMMATEIFGPNGVGWGLEIEDERYVDGKPHLNGKGECIGKDVIHVIRAHVWYIIDGKTYKTSPQFGQTTFVGTNRNGPFTDEEAPKKSVTDVQNKCLSLLGFASDIFLGRWDDDKYQQEVKQQQNKEAAKQQQKKAATDWWDGESLNIPVKSGDWDNWCKRIVNAAHGARHAADLDRLEDHNQISIEQLSEEGKLEITKCFEEMRAKFSQKKNGKEELPTVQIPMGEGNSPDWKAFTDSLSSAIAGLKTTEDIDKVLKAHNGAISNLKKASSELHDHLGDQIKQQRAQLAPKQAAE